MSPDSPTVASSFGTSSEEYEVPEDIQWERKERRGQRYDPYDFERMENTFRRHTLQPSDPFSSSNSDPSEETWVERTMRRR